MPTLLFKNNATTTLSGSINNSQTSITVVSSGSFPAPSAGDYFYATMYEVSAGTEINIEIVKVTGVVGNNWTVVRAQDGTTGRARDGISTCYIENRYTAASAALPLQKDNNLSDLASASTARTSLGLGTMATQNASAVAITGGTISGVTLDSLDSQTTIKDNTDPTKAVAFEVSSVATGTTRTLTVPNASGTIALTSDLSAGYQPLDSDLTAIAALAANGLIARTGTGTVSVRAITQPAAGITVTNGDGVSGNPTLGLANDLAAVESLSTTGFVRRTGADTWSASALVDADIPGALTGKTYNGVTLTSLPTVGFSIAGGTTSKTLTVNKTLTLDGTDGTTITLPATTGTVALNNQTFFLGTTSVAINRSSASISLTGVSIDGSAGSATSATSATTATHIAGGLANQIHYQTGAGATSFITAPSVASTFLQWNGSAFTWAATSGGSVTSVAVSSSDLTVSGSPITTSGTISLSLNTVGIAKGGTGATTKLEAFDNLSPATTLGDLIYSDGTDNVRLAGNTLASKRFLVQTGTGTVSAAPAWGSIVDGDLPSALTGKTYNALTLTAATTGFTVAGGTNSKTLTINNSVGLSGTDNSTLNIGTGGTLGSAAFTASTAYAPTIGSTSVTTLGTIGTGTWQGSAIGVGYGGTGATDKTTAFNNLSPITTLGDLVYGDGTNSAVRLAGSTSASKRFLTQTGTGTVSAAPGWNAIVDGDLPSALTGKTYNGLTLTANSVGFSVAGGTTSKTLQVNNNLTFSGTDGSTLNIGGGGTLGTGAYATISDYLTSATAASTYLPLAGGTLTGDLTFSGASRRITGDFSSNSPISDRLIVQTSTANSNTLWTIMPSGSSTTSRFIALNNSSPTNSNALQLSALSTDVRIQSFANGSASALPLHLMMGGTTVATVSTGNNFLVGTITDDGVNKLQVSGSAAISGAITQNGNQVLHAGNYTSYAPSLTGSGASGTWGISVTGSAASITGTYSGTLTSGQVTTALGYTPYNSTNPSGYITGSSPAITTPTITGTRETRVAMGASDINLAAGNYFTRTISGTTTLTVSNVPSSGTATSLILDLTNGGSATINWWSGMKWAGGTAPTLTSSGRDVLGFFTHDGGSTWTGLLLGKDVK